MGLLITDLATLIAPALLHGVAGAALVEDPLAGLGIAAGVLREGRCRGEGKKGREDLDGA